jgi:Subtilase family
MDMTANPMRRAGAALLSALYLFCSVATAQPQSFAPGVLSADVQKIYQSAAQGISASTPLPPELKSTARFDPSGRVHVKVDFNCAGSVPLTGLVGAGLTVTTQVKVPPLCAVEGYIAITALPALSRVSGVLKVELPAYAIPRSPRRHLSESAGSATRLTQAIGGTVIDGAAITLMHVDQFISSTAVNGSGIAVGVLSGDATHLATITAAGELPGTISLYPASTNPHPTDEGTMMLEEVHALAPGAGLAFCGPQSETEFVACLQSMIAGGATVLVDDLAYVDDAMSNQGTFAQAVQSLLAQHPKVMFFSSVGNYEGSYWEGTFTPNVLSTALTCPANGQTDLYVQPFGGVLNNTLTLKATLTLPIALQWADPWNANVSNFDLYILDQNYNILACVPGAGSNLTADIVPNPNLTAGTYHLAVGAPSTQLADKLLKLIVLGDGVSQLSAATSGGVLSPHKYVSGVITVGAVDGADGIGATIEPYSSTGPITLAFPATSLQAPQLVAPDNIYVDVTGTDFASQASNGMFQGTSAAAPNAAAVATLLMAAFPGATPAQLFTALKQGAIPLGSGVPNGTYGYGRVDAMGALNALPAPSIAALGAMTFVAGSASVLQTSLSLTGVGVLSMAVTSNNTALLPASSVVLDSGCRASGTCTVSLTPQALQSGVVDLTFAVTDGAHRTGSAVLVVTVNKPAPPTLTVTGQGTQEVKLGGVVTPATVVANGTGTMTITASSSNSALLPNSSVSFSGAPCGSSGAACLVTMTPFSGAYGTATITVTATDAYDQSGQTTVTLTVDAPPPPLPAPSKGGGGALDFWALAGLAAAWALKQRPLRILSGLI